MMRVHLSDMYHNHVFCYNYGCTFFDTSIFYMLWSLFLLKVLCSSNWMCRGSVSSTVVTILK